MGIEPRGCGDGRRGAVDTPPNILTTGPNINPCDAPSKVGPPRGFSDPILRVPAPVWQTRNPPFPVLHLRGKKLLNFPKPSDAGGL